MTIEARLMDPRDVNVLVDTPRFRVHLWGPPPGFACREYEVIGADVDEVIEWAERNREPAGSYELGVLAPAVPLHDGDVVLMRIKGTDPTRSEGGGGTAAAAHG